jgi:hypothetical protein
MPTRYCAAMGTWGHGNLDSDYALDELSTRTNELLTSLLRRAQRKESREYDEYDHTTLFVEFEIVFALDAYGILATGRFPAGALVRTLALEFLVVYDEYMEGPWPERRAKIAETFERFAALCDKHEGVAALPGPEVKPAPRATQASATPGSKSAAPKKAKPTKKKPAAKKTKPAKKAKKAKKAR